MTGRTGPIHPRRPSPLGGRRPRRDELAQFAGETVDDLLHDRVRLLVVGINPGLWTAAVNAPFARPGNRFWPSLHRAGLTGHQLDVAHGLTDEDAAHLRERGLGITNLVARATVRADELTREELRAGRQRLTELVPQLAEASGRLPVVAVAGVTAFRDAWEDRKAVLGRREDTVAGAPLWVVPQPSGLNAHENVDTLAEKWRAVAAEVDWD
ncbi:mismatch-specific DNA-glycosylase [Kytococcus sp. Marseille-QA3725]